MLKDVIARNQVVKRNTVNVIKVGYLVQIYVYVKDAKTAMEKNKESFHKC
jgi:hypothetical protein